MVAQTSSETINSLLEEMKPLLLVAGVPEGQIRVRDGRLQIKTLSAAFDWLHNFKMSDEFSELIKIRKLLPEATWRRYTLYEIDGLREQKLLEVVTKKVAKKWKSRRPSIFNPNKKRRNDAEKK